MIERRIRRLAVAIGRLAAKASLERHSELARGMQAEVDHIDGDFEALSYSVGCLWAGLRMRILTIRSLIAFGQLGLSAGLAGLACMALFVSGAMRGSGAPTAILIALGLYYALGSWVAAKPKAMLLVGFSLTGVIGAGLALGALHAAQKTVQHPALYEALAIEVAAIATALLIAAGAMQALRGRLRVSERYGA